MRVKEGEMRERVIQKMLKANFSQLTNFKDSRDVTHLLEIRNKKFIPFVGKEEMEEIPTLLDERNLKAI